MGQLSVTIPHRLGQDRATAKIKELVPKLKQEHGDQIDDVWEEWQGSSARFGFRTHGFDITGSLKVSHTAVTIAGNLPFLASFFSGQIEDAIRSEASKLLT